MIWVCELSNIHEMVVYTVSSTWFVHGQSIDHHMVIVIQIGTRLVSLGEWVYRLERIIVSSALHLLLWLRVVSSLLVVVARVSLRAWGS